MSKYLVHCDGCGMPTVVDSPYNFTCTNCGYQTCTIDEKPTPVIGKELADFWEDVWLNGSDKVQE